MKSATANGLMAIAGFVGMVSAGFLFGMILYTNGDYDEPIMFDIGNFRLPPYYLTIGGLAVFGLLVMLAVLVFLKFCKLPEVSVAAIMARWMLGGVIVGFVPLMILVNVWVDFGRAQIIEQEHRAENALLRIEKLPVVKDRYVTWQDTQRLYYAVKWKRAYTMEGKPLRFQSDEITLDELESYASQVYASGGWYYLSSDNGERIEYAEPELSDDLEINRDRLKSAVLNSMKGNQTFEDFKEAYWEAYYETCRAGVNPDWALLY